MRGKTMQLKQAIRNVKRMEEKFETAINKVIDALHMYTHIAEQHIATILLCNSLATENDKEATVEVFNEFRKYAMKYEAYEVLIIIAEQEKILNINEFTTAN